MSGYWDAVVRTALGLTGTAAPRPRSLFEPDDARLAIGEGDLTEDPGVASASAETPAAVPRGDIPAAPPIPPFDRDVLPPHPNTAQDEERQSASPSLPLDDTRDDRPAESFPVTRVVEERVTHTERIVERVEVQRIDTHHTIVEVSPDTRSDEPRVPFAGVVAEAAIAARADVSHERTPGPRADREAAPAVVLAAEAGSPPEMHARQAPAPEPPVFVIEIDHIDIRIESGAPAAPAVPRRREPEAIPSLADYLQRRSEARS
jgi:hypothetical protein